jgi:hypothetical protein
MDAGNNSVHKCIRFQYNFTAYCVKPKWTMVDEIHPWENFDHNNRLEIGSVIMYNADTGMQNHFLGQREQNKTTKRMTVPR